MTTSPSGLDPCRGTTFEPGGEGRRFLLDYPAATADAGPFPITRAATRRSPTPATTSVLSARRRDPHRPLFP